MDKFLKIFLVSSAIGLAAQTIFAANLSISETGLSFSNDAPVAGQAIKIYARVFNLDGSDALATVTFFANKSQIGTAQTFSRANGYDDVFINWTPAAGNYTVQAKLPDSDGSAKNIVVKKDFFVDSDNNHNGIGDTIDAKVAAAKAAQEAEQAKINGSPDSNSPETSIDPKDNFLTDFSNSNPVKSTLSNINNAINKKIGSWLGIDLGGTDNKATKKPAKSNNLNLSQWTAGIGALFTKYFGNKNYAWFLLAIPAIVVILLLFFRRKDKPASTEK